MNHGGKLHTTGILIFLVKSTWRKFLIPDSLRHFVKDSRKLRVSKEFHRRSQCATRIGPLFTIYSSLRRKIRRRILSNTYLISLAVKAEWHSILTSSGPTRRGIPFAAA